MKDRVRYFFVEHNTDVPQDDLGVFVANVNDDDQLLYRYVQAAENLSAGDPVFYYDNYPIVAKTVGSISGAKYRPAGIVYDDITANYYGYIQVRGFADGISCSGTVYENDPIALDDTGATVALVSDATNVKQFGTAASNSSGGSFDVLVETERYC